MNLKSFSLSDLFLVLNFLFANHSLAFHFVLPLVLHCNLRWDTKDDANDQDNGFVCKRKIWSTRWTEHLKNYLWTVFITKTNENNTKLDITLYILVLWVLVWNGNELCLLCLHSMVVTSAIMHWLHNAGWTSLSVVAKKRKSQFVKFATSKECVYLAPWENRTTIIVYIDLYIYLRLRLCLIEPLRIF